MTAQSVSLFMQEVLDKTGCTSVKLINDNGSQLISKDFREVLSSADIKQIRIRRNHPQIEGGKTTVDAYNFEKGRTEK